MRHFVRLLDHFLSRIEGVFEFSEDPECILRLQVGKAVHSIKLEDGHVEPDQPVIFIHFWNEKIPKMPQDGADFVWARSAQRQFVYSLGLIAQLIQQDEALFNIVAIGGVTVLFPSDRPEGGNRLMRRLGFTIIPYQNPLGKFGMFWENFYSWLLIWTYNPASLKANTHSLLKLPRTEIWISRTQLLTRFAKDPTTEL